MDVQTWTQEPWARGVGIAVKAAVSLAGGYKEKKDIICASGSLEPNWVTSNVPPYPPQKNHTYIKFQLTYPATWKWVCYSGYHLG